MLKATIELDSTSPSTNTTLDPLVLSKDASERSRGLSDGDDIALLWRNEEQHDKRQHSLTVAVTGSQKWGA